MDDHSNQYLDDAPGTPEQETTNLSQAEPFARKVQLALAANDHRRAHEAVNQHLIEGISAKYHSGTNLCEIKEMKLRTVNHLEQADILTVGDLAAVSRERLLSIPSVKERTIYDAMQAVIRAMARTGEE